MYVYRTINQQIWTVGYFEPNGTWKAESEHHSPVTAAARTAWLNGQPSLCPHCGKPTAREVYTFDQAPSLLQSDSRIAAPTHPDV